MTTPARRFTIYDQRGLYRASANTVQLALIAVASLGNGATIRDRHSIIVWTEGEEICSATDTRAVAIIEGRAETARVMRSEGARRFTIYDSRSEYRASINDWRLAAQAVARLGNGSTIREHQAVIVWTEGEEGFPASDTDPRVKAIIEDRAETARVMREEASKDAGNVTFGAGPVGDKHMGGH